MLINIDIMMRVFMKNLCTKCLEIEGKQPQFKVPIENSLLSSLSLLVKRFAEEIQPFEDLMDTIRD